jgi:hypothetical protein
LLVGKKGPFLYQLLRRACPGGARRQKPDKLEKIAMKFRPLHDRVMIRRVDPEGRTTGGIIIPDTCQEKPMEGEIVAVGPGARDEKGKVVPLDVRRATASCSANGRAPRSSSTARIS